MPIDIQKSRRPLALAVALVLSGGANAATMTVDTTADTILDDSHCTLREAIQALTDGADENGCSHIGPVFGTNDIIVFDSVGVPFNSTITLSGTELSVSGLGAPLTIDGSNPLLINGKRSHVTIDANGLSRVLHLESATLSVKSLTLTGGRVYPSSAAGGVYVYDSTLMLTDTTISGNSAPYGGGMYARGAVFGAGNDVTLNNCTVSGNYAYEDAGIAGGGKFTLVNSTVSGNRAVNWGGGLTLQGSTSVLINSTVSNNTAGTYGAGLYTSRGYLTLKNTIVSGNRLTGGGASDLRVSPYTSATLVSATYSLLGTALQAAYGAAGNHNVFTDNPGLGLLVDNGGITRTMALLPGSPGVDAGSNALVPIDVSYDQRDIGYPRIVNGTVDIGAFELGSGIFANGFESGP